MTFNQIEWFTANCTKCLDVHDLDLKATGKVEQNYPLYNLNPLTIKNFERMTPENEYEICVQSDHDL